MPSPTAFLLLLLLLAGDLHGSVTGGLPTHFSATTVARSTVTDPLSPKGSLLRYWSRKIPNGVPIPPFLLSKVSPLSAVLSARLEAYLASERLPSLPRSFCSSAGLLCFPNVTISSDLHNSSSFTSYSPSTFSKYGTSSSSGDHSFTVYSGNGNVGLDSFRRYSRGSRSHSETFSVYANDANVVTANFTSYATNASSASGTFASYFREANIPDLRFSNYDTSADRRRRSFSNYSDDANSGDESFSGYGGKSANTPTSFVSYGSNSNVVGSAFTSYAGGGAANVNDSFTSYSSNTNVPTNTFRSYADRGNGNISVRFSSYRDDSNVGDDSFQSYAKHTAGAAVGFRSYGQSYNAGSDQFQGYGKDAMDPTVSFRTYGQNSTFLDYQKGSPPGVTFSDYRNSSSSFVSNPTVRSDGMQSGKPVNRWIEPGKFFRESQLRIGSVMPMPDIRDRMPFRAFLPRSISNRIPFSSTGLGELSRLFNATLDTALWKAMAGTVGECEREPSRGETKRCARSIEEMVDFATSVLGSDVAVRSTESTSGSGRVIRVGKVHGINGGRVTKSVSCHQSLFPYMVYYCHSVPKVRVYEAEILAVGSGEAINRAVAICHLDTSAWSGGHGAFVALGRGPGMIEVCHWIYPGDMTWAAAD